MIKERSKNRLAALERGRPNRGENTGIPVNVEPEAEELWNSFWKELEAAKAISKEHTHPYYKALGDLLSLSAPSDEFHSTGDMIVKRDVEGIRTFSLDNVTEMFANVERSFTKSYRYKDLTRPVLD